MAPSRRSRSLGFALLTLAPLMPSTWATFDCSDVAARGVHFNLKKLGGPHTVHWTENRVEDEEILHYNFTVDLCNTLKRKKGEPSCHQGTRVCGIRERVDTEGRHNATIDVIDIAGTYTMDHNGQLDARFELLRNSESNSDQGKEGIRAELHGGRHPYNDNKEGVDQRAIIEFVCDKDREGTEKGEVDEGGDRGEDDGEDKADDNNGDKKEKRLRRRDDETKGKCEDSDASLRFCGYQKEQSEKNKLVSTLRLEWRSKYACEDAPQDASSHWGFFTWFIIIAFLATAAYLIFGSWLNYNRYGARGWDLLPHGDTIRDIPYIFKDFGRKVINTVQSPGSRGGYSAV
ncbi:autophagy protein-like protein Atg27 [Lentithecium fluviatile CBS 122367]|uniref:Autophagy-related protein 27 n=1 Tax=Lentithecium fluviatile CBS 122367 TaxID=1168545 RepID=A0A6G1IZK0_9PLEO|nr:autophagy protein-like protein Atg27 [Lentithecium fluviatile CBS 122367]